jgi:hypothetical protein
MTINKPHSKFKHVFAILSFDFPIDPESPASAVTVVKCFHLKGLPIKKQRD